MAVSTGDPAARGGQAPGWRGLTKEQQCVFISADEQSMLIGVLVNWEPGLDWPGRILHVDRLAEAAASFQRRQGSHRQGHD